MVTCHMNMLNSAKIKSSRQLGLGTRKGTFMSHKAAPSTGVPINKQMNRKVSGGKPVTPSFKTGQLMPQTKVKCAKTNHWRVVSGCTDLILEPN